MSFNNFCNICFMKENIIKLCVEENEPILNTLISFTSYLDIVNGIIYLCIKCCNKLEECDKIRELFLTNFVRFRYLYNEYKKQLEIRNVPDIEKQLKTFVEVNVERPSGTPLIENYETAQALIHTTASNLDTCKESDGEFFKRDELENINDSRHAGTSSSLKNNVLKNKTHTCYVKYENVCFNEDQDNIHESTVAKREPTSLDEAYSELTNTVTTSISCSSSTFTESSNLLVTQEIFEIENTNLEKAEPNPDRFEESHDPLVSDIVTNTIPCHDSADIYDLPTKPENFATDDTTNEQGDTDYEKATKFDTVCNVCDERCSCNNELEVHLRTHTGEKHYDCDKCHKTFSDSDNLVRHKRLHNSKRRNKCDEFDLRFTERDHLPYSCAECKKTFKYIGQLIAHKRVHTGERPYKCDECGMRFKQQSHISSHKRVHTGEKPYKCDDCGLRFSVRINLNAHKRIHTGEKPYSCDECQKKFTHGSTLIQHKLIHSGEKPYKCLDCGKGFGQRCDLKRHKLTHTGEKPYSCDECQKTFRDNSHLIIHKRIHSGEKPHKCEECGFGFLQRSTLKRHIRTHTGESPYSCDVCHKTFKRNSNLIAHKRIHNDKKK